MKKLTDLDINHPKFQSALYNVIQRGVRDIKAQTNPNGEKTEKSILSLRIQRILMEKLKYAIIYKRVKIEIKIIN